MKNSLIITALISTFITGTSAQVSSVVDQNAPATPLRPSTTALLNQRIEEVSVDAAPLDQVVRWLADLTEINVVVQWQVLEELGIERDRPITLHINNLRLSQALWLILSEAGGPDVNLAYRIEADLLLITSQEILDRDLVTKVYDVADLLLKAPRFGGCPQVNLTAATGNGQTSALDDHGSSGSQDERESSNARQTKTDQLMEIITDTVEPDSWVNNGGRGTIASFDNLLIIRNTCRVHQLLGGVVE